MSFLSRSLWPACAALVALLGAGSAAALDTQGPLGLAMPVSGLVVDGDLSDWPDDMARIPLRNEFGVYGRTDLEGVDLDDSDDFRPEMRVGWDGASGFLYVAVEARDDVLHAFGTGHLRDGIEVYVSTLEEGAHPWQYFAYTQGNAQRYVLNQANDDWAYDYDDGRIAYEWRGRLLDRDRRPVGLQAGDVIGFDVVAVDSDGDGTTAWIPWGPPIGSKVAGNDRVGRLILAPEGTPAEAAAALASILDSGDPTRGTFDLSEAADRARQRAHLTRHQVELVKHSVALAEHQARLSRQAAAHGDPEEVIEREIERIEEEIERVALEIERSAEAGGEEVEAEQVARLVEVVALGIARAATAVRVAEARVEIDADGFAPPVPPVPPDLVHIGSHGGTDPRSTGWSDLFGVVVMLLIAGAFVVAGTRQRRAESTGTRASAQERIETIESRLTDTQDVMIALSEKIDRLSEDDGARGRS